MSICEPGKISIGRRRTKCRFKKSRGFFWGRDLAECKVQVSTKQKRPDWVKTLTERHTNGPWIPGKAVILKLKLLQMSQIQIFIHLMGFELMTEAIISELFVRMTLEIENFVLLHVRMELKWCSMVIRYQLERWNLNVAAPESMVLKLVDGPTKETYWPQDRILIYQRHVSVRFKNTLNSPSKYDFGGFFQNYTHL